MAAKTTKAAAKTAGKAKAAVKALAGQSGILRHLVGEHGEVSSLMKRIARTAEGSALREELFPEVKKELLAHAKSEEKVFYPELRKHAELRDLIQKSKQQHERVEKKLKKLSSGNKATKTWLLEFERMQRAVEEHVELEEKTIFPQTRELFSGDELSDMLERYEKEEEAQKKKLG